MDRRDDSIQYQMDVVCSRDKSHTKLLSENEEPEETCPLCYEPFDGTKSHGYCCK